MWAHDRTHVVVRGTTCGSRFSPSTMWYPGSECRPSGLKQVPWPTEPSCQSQDPLSVIQFSVTWICSRSFSSIFFCRSSSKTLFCSWLNWEDDSPLFWGREQVMSTQLRSFRGTSWGAQHLWSQWLFFYMFTLFKPPCKRHSSPLNFA